MSSVLPTVIMIYNNGIVGIPIFAEGETSGDPDQLHISTLLDIKIIIKERT